LIWQDFDQQYDQERAMDKSQRKSPIGKQQGPAQPANEGEGSRSAARDYNERTERFIHSGKVDESAKKAERAVDSSERKELTDAEKIGRSHAKS
jgi:hypothetical protein